MRKHLAIAATLLILFIPGIYWFISDYNSAKSNEALFSCYFQLYDDLISVRSNDVDNIELGMRSYNEKRYEEAIHYLRLVATDDLQKNAADLNLGISYLSTNQSEKAKAVFSLWTEDEAKFFKAWQKGI